MKNKPNQLYDLKELRTIADGDAGFTDDMIRLFISQNETALKEIGNLIVNRDYAAIKTILHKMKPSVMVMGITTVTEIIEQVEHLEVSDKNDALFSDIFLKLEKTLKMVNVQLRMI